LRKAPPADFSPASPDSLKRFSTYLEEKGKAMPPARDAYLEVFKMRRPPWNVAAAARVGQSYQNFAQQLRGLAIPKNLSTDEERKIYCKAMEDQAAPIAGKAIEAFETCTKTADENDGKGSWSELCERELGRLKSTAPAPSK